MSATGTCNKCKQPCIVIAEDYGIGYYEYGSYHGNDVQIVYASDCCDAGISKLEEEEFNYD